MLTWYPEALAGESRALGAAAQRLDNAVARLADTLALIPSAWTGVAAGAVRIALASEWRTIADHHGDIVRLYHAAEAAHRAVSEKHRALLDQVAAAEAAGFEIDTSVPARGPITVRGPEGGKGDGPGVGEGGGDGAAKSFAEAIASIAGALLDADAEHAGILVGIADGAESRMVAAAVPAAIDAALAEREVEGSRYPKIPGIGNTGNGLVRDAVGMVPVLGTTLDVHEGLLAVEENRTSPGEVLLHALGAKTLDHAGGLVGGSVGAARDSPRLENVGGFGGSYVASEALGGPVERLVDATLLPAAHWAATGVGSDVFGPSDKELAARALRDAVRYGG
ncbi:WXG100 family type VII secretion target [Dietzia sp.]|uniref:WXG100 family type VII secretion target n=1 Tax=Dietzia sp. TaxID=1871616 RepID=UPI002FD8EAF6